MLRHALYACFALACSVVAPASAADKDFTITWYGQAFYTVTTPSGRVIAFDPHVMREFDRKDPIKADYVCISHEHNDHNRVEEGIVDGKDPAKVKIFRGTPVDPAKPDRPGEWKKIDETITAGDVKIRVRSFGCYHDEVGGLKRGKNSAFIVEAEGITFCHVGDLGHVFTEEEAKVIGKIDVLFVPIGGSYTLNGEAAWDLAKVLKPRLYVVPMHYAVDGEPDTLIGPDEFVEYAKEIKKLTDTNEYKFPASEKLDTPTALLLGWQKK